MDDSTYDDEAEGEDKAGDATEEEDEEEEEEEEQEEEEEEATSRNTRCSQKPRPPWGPHA